MEVKARLLGEPVFDFLLFVGRVVVGNALGSAGHRGTLG